jgi:hypothetical protein
MLIDIAEEQAVQLAWVNKTPFGEPVVPGVINGNDVSRFGRDKRMRFLQAHNLDPLHRKYLHALFFGPSC